MILEGCNETHNDVTELHRQEFRYSAVVTDN